MSSEITALSAKQKILYISYDGMTDPLGQSQVLPYLRGLSKHGYEFHLVSFEKHDRFIQHKSHIQHICDEAGINWHPQDYAVEGGLKKTRKQIKRMKKVVRYLHQIHQFDMTHCRSYISALAGMELKSKHGVKMLFDMRGFWADERVDGGLWNLSNPLYKLIYNYFKKKELQYFNGSDYTISLTEAGKKEILSWPKIRSDIGIEVIPCCVDLDLFDPEKISEEQQDKLKSYHGLSDADVVMGYVGSIGTWYMLPEMLDYFEEFKRHEPNAKFLFVTGEKPETILLEAAGKGINEEDIIITSCLHKDVPLHISLFDLSIFFIRPTFSKKASSPTKQGEIMAMGVPLVCNAGVGDTDTIVEKYNAGIVLPECTAKAYQNGIIDPLSFKKERIMQGANEYFSLEEGVKRYLRVYEKING